MTRVKRPLKQSPYRVVRAFFLVACTLAAALMLYQIDAFHEKRRRKETSSTRPEDLLLRQEQKKLQSQNDDQDDEEEAPPDLPADRQNGDQQEARDSLHRKFVIQLAGLSNDDSGGGSDSHRVVMETRADWAPIGVAHFERLVEEAQFYDQCRFFRVVPNFVVQFGIAGEPEVQKEWKGTVLKDDPVEYSNERGTISFATSGPNTRTTQLFVNLGNNEGLDGQGFAPIGRILGDGMEWIDKINSAHRQKPVQGKIVQRGNAYLKEEFPDLSYIESIRPFEEEDAETDS